MMHGQPVPSFKGVLPQLAGAVALLDDVREASGLWYGDLWLSAKCLRARSAFQDRTTVEDSRMGGSVDFDGLVSALRDSARDIEESKDLYPRLDDRLRSACASYSVAVGRVTGQQERILGEARHPIEKLLEFGAQYAEAMASVNVAEEVLDCIPKLGLPQEKLGILTEPWLRLAVRAMLAEGRTLDRLRAYLVLRRALDTQVLRHLESVWKSEAPRVRKELGREALDVELAREGARIAERFDASSLEDLSVLCEARAAEADEGIQIPSDVVPKLLSALQKALADFRAHERATQAIALVSLASTVDLLSRSTVVRVVTFGANDEKRLLRAVGQLEALEQKRALIVSNTKYVTLAVLAIILGDVWAGTIWWFNRDLYPVAALVAGLVTVLVPLLFLRER